MSLRNEIPAPAKLAELLRELAARIYLWNENDTVETREQELLRRGDQIRSILETVFVELVHDDGEIAWQFSTYVRLVCEADYLRACAIWRQPEDGLTTVRDDLAGIRPGIINRTARVARTVSRILEPEWAIPHEVDRFRESCIRKLQELEVLCASIAQSPAETKKKGRKGPDTATKKREEDIVNAWHQAHAAGFTVAQFAADQGMDQKSCRRLLDRVRRREGREAKKRTDK